MMFQLHIKFSIIGRRVLPGLFIFRGGKHPARTLSGTLPRKNSYDADIATAVVTNNGDYRSEIKTRFRDKGSDAKLKKMI